MDAHKSKAVRTERRRYRVRKAIHGTAVKPRLSVHRTNMQIYAQLIDDDAEVTIAAAASNAKDGKLKYGGNIAAAAEVGKKIAEKAKAKGINEATFDRGGCRFHGRVKALARAATLAGLKCTGLEDKKKEAPAAAPEAKKEKPKKEASAKA
ncbi:50S ribosomal protein L18 [Limnoglobus roseus]|uniref:Large ribosomal subunit protein uL18 n=1 Tax=Limnoglobus roseus TaxID=2598579 RepID=A0A5C1AP98_9BACT|nr:50S ribosomal protein L18 [Limnoglobus roseus]QEL19977.1 50S ribosomal protein L18 [Limnoglobus roseus]